MVMQNSKVEIVCNNVCNKTKLLTTRATFHTALCGKWSFTDTLDIPWGICWMEIYISSKLIFKLILGIDAGGMSSEIVRRLMSLDLTNI